MPQLATTSDPLTWADCSLRQGTVGDVAGPTEVRIKLPGSAYLPVALLAICVTPIVQHPAGALIYLIPLVALAYVIRTGTFAGPDGITARALLGSQRIDWAQLRGLSTDQRGRIYAARSDGKVVRLPCTRARHLAVLAMVSGGRLDAPA